MSTTLKAAFDAVRAFHIAFSHAAPSHPRKQTVKAARHRAKWIREEVKELCDARALVDQADAYLDIIYFAVGGLVELGIEPSRMFDIVQAANMAKLWPDGKPRQREDGKVLKPVGWVAPEALLEAEVERQCESVTT